MTNHCLIGDLWSEKYLFVWLNSQHFPLGDQLMWVVTNKHTWIPVVIGLFFTMFYRHAAKQAFWLLLMIAILATLSDQLSAGTIKPAFACLRPSHHPEYTDVIHILNNYRGGQYGFVSAHATNSFALAWFLSFVFKNRLLTVVLFVWAVLNSYSRIYLGVHFVLDIVGGALLGTLIGLSVYHLYVWGRQSCLKESRIEANMTFIREQSSQRFAIGFIIYLAILWSYAVVLTVTALGAG